MPKSKTTPAEPEPGASPRQWLNYEQAAEYLGCTSRQIRRFVASGEIAHVKIGLHVRFSQEHLDDYLAANTYTPRRAS